MAPRMKIESAQPASAPAQEQKATTTKATSKPAPKVETKVTTTTTQTTTKATEPASKAAKKTRAVTATIEPEQKAAETRTQTRKTTVDTATRVDDSRASATTTQKASPASAMPSAESDSPREGRKGIAAMQESATGWVSRTFPGHEHAFYGAVLAVFVALMVFAIGFWRVLFIALLVVVGIAVGQLFDGDPKIIAAIRELLTNDRDSNG